MWGCAHTDNPAGFSKEFEAVPNFRLSWGEALRQQSAACWPVRICQTPVLTVFVCCSSLLSAYASEDGLAAASYSQQYQGECAQWWVRKTSPAHNSGGKFLVSVFPSHLWDPCCQATAGLFEVQQFVVYDVAWQGSLGNSFAAIAHLSSAGQTCA